MSAGANGNHISELALLNRILYSTNIKKDEKKIKRLISFLFESPLYSMTPSIQVRISVIVNVEVELYVSW